MFELAREYGNGTVLLRQIAERQEISDKYLSQLIIPLKNSRLINSSRGAHGGYSLAKHPKEITVKEIVQSLEGPFALVECVPAPDVCNRSADCVAREIWANAIERVSSYLESVTLSDMVKMAEKSKSPKRKGKRRKK
jgi:Rrf2 family protein